MSRASQILSEMNYQSELREPREFFLIYTQDYFTYKSDPMFGGITDFHAHMTPGEMTEYLTNSDLEDYQERVTCMFTHGARDPYGGRHTVLYFRSLASARVAIRDFAASLGRAEHSVEFYLAHENVHLQLLYCEGTDERFTVHQVTEFTIDTHDGRVDSGHTDNDWEYMKRSTFGIDHNFR